LGLNPKNNSFSFVDGKTFISLIYSFMAKKTKVSKTPKKEEDNLHLEVVLLDDVCEVLMKNIFHSMDILRDAVFDVECSRKKTK
jgi:hypothetical protein